MSRRSSLTLLSVVAVALFTVWTPVALAQEAHRTNAPDGAWTAIAYMPDGSQLPFMDLYTSNPMSPGVSGTVLCTLSVPAFETPFGKLNMTTSGHGNWVRTDRNRYAFTAWRILIDADPSNPVPDGAPMGMVKFRGTITTIGHGTFEGTMTADYYDVGGTLFWSFSFTTVGRRIVVEPE
jgi:hypothetical protein